MGGRGSRRHANFGWRSEQRRKLLAGSRTDRQCGGTFTRDEIIFGCEKAGVPFAPIARPEDLFTDPQLNQGAGLLPTTFPGGVRTKMPRLPIEVGRHNFGIRRDPAAIGADTRDVLRGAGYTDLEIDALLAKGVVAAPKR